MTALKCLKLKVLIKKIGDLGPPQFKNEKPPEGGYEKYEILLFRLIYRNG